VLTGNPFHSEGSGVATSTFTRLAAASVLAIGSLMRTLRSRLCPWRYLLETCMQAALAQPHIHRQIIDHKRIDAGNAGNLAHDRRPLCQPRKPLRAFPISNPGKDPLASNRCIVYLFNGEYRNGVGLFAESIQK
jgi:hypothetical protein